MIGKLVKIIGPDFNGEFGRVIAITSHQRWPIVVDLVVSGHTAFDLDELKILIQRG